MKKMFAALSALTLLASMSLTAVAETPAAPETAGRPMYGARVCFVDADNNGICDNMGQRQGNRGQRRANFVDENNDGVCDNMGQRQENRGKKSRKNRAQSSRAQNRNAR